MSQQESAPRASSTTDHSEETSASGVKETIDRCWKEITDE